MEVIMNEIVKPKTANNTVTLIGQSGTGLTIPRPFEKDIYLFDTYVAGTSHVANIEVVQNTLKIGTRLNFYREPKNQYDPQAIVIKIADGVKIGYVPRKDNIIFARLMDAGKLLFGKITDIDKKGKWLKIKIQVFLHE